jgi:hypothetical protein
LPELVPLKLISSAVVSWPGGIRSMARSIMKTRWCSCRSLGFVFCLDGFMYRHGLPSLSKPKMVCLPVSFSMLMYSGVNLERPYSRRHVKVASKRFAAASTEWKDVARR